MMNRPYQGVVKVLRLPGTCQHTAAVARDWFSVTSRTMTTNSTGSKQKTRPEEMYVVLHLWCPSLRAMFCLEFISVCMYVCMRASCMFILHASSACILHAVHSRVIHVFACCAVSHTACRRDSVYFVVDLLCPLHISRSDAPIVPRCCRLGQCEWSPDTESAVGASSGGHREVIGQY